MTRKDYNLAAKIVRTHRATMTSWYDGDSFWTLHADRLQDVYIVLFRSDNPLFDEKRFIRACKPKTK